MHEYGLVSGIVEAIDVRARELGASRVASINLRVGERAGISDDSLQFYFEMLAAGTPAEGARICIQRAPLTFHCTRCDRPYAPREDSFDCPTCGEVGQVEPDGTELVLESMEIEA